MKGVKFSWLVSVSATLDIIWIIVIVKQNRIKTKWADADEKYSRRTQNLIQIK